MKYFFDTEFIEGFRKPLFGKRSHFIDLISIGIVSEDGREYYAISNEFNPKDADDWVRENVIDKLEAELFQQQPAFAKSNFNFSLKELLKQYGKSNKQIAKEILDFIYSCEYPQAESMAQKAFVRLAEISPEFYAYYADYDWVLFCSLFGRMIDLPKGFTMYCKDLKQMLDEKVSALSNSDFFTKFHLTEEITLDEKLNEIKKHTLYPEQSNEHNALSDAKWNRELYHFIQIIPK